MRRRALLAAVALAMSAGASFAAGPRIVSMNICTDQLLLALADPAQIIGLSRFSRDARQGWVEGAQKFPILSGGYEELAEHSSVPVGTIKTWIHRAVEKLQLCLSQ